jgi:ribonucleoside-diphosphate reductase alpha chain
MEEVIHHAIRFLDTCIDLNHYSLAPIRQTAQRGRRIGLGVMGMADMLFAMGIKYGSIDCLDTIEKLFKFIRNVSYQASIKLATEKGAFPAYDAFNYCKSKFIRTLPPSLRSDIREHGIRNVTVNAVAPTGTISLVANTTSSIEPLMYKAYKRKDRVSERTYIHEMYGNYLSNGGTPPDFLIDSRELGPMDHVEVQSAIQKYMDGAVSKTILLPADYTSDNLSNLLLESIFDLKGVTVYRDGSREGQPVIPMTDEEARACLNESECAADVETVVCAGGVCDV